MGTLVKSLKHNRSVIFDKGRFDHWCVYVVEANGVRKAPLDETYFNELYLIACQYPTDKVYNDFVKIYERTTKEISGHVLSLIDQITTTYTDQHKLIIEQWFTVVYAGMVAEENKQFAILKKRIKRLGLYQVLKLGMPAKEAAKFSYGKKWKELDALMTSLGF